MRHFIPKAAFLLLLLVMAFPTLAQVSTNVEALKQISKEQEKTC